MMATDKYLTELYESALHRVLERGWADDVQYFRELTFDKVNGQFFFRECSFCIYASGFSNYVLSTKWKYLTQAYRNWNYEEVREHKAQVRLQALSIINHKKRSRQYWGAHRS